MASASEAPDGIESDGIRQCRWQQHANPAALVLLALWLGVGLSGMVGGHANPVYVNETDDARVVVDFPEVLRNGELFEMRAGITAKTALQNPTLALSADYWRELTINSFMPTPVQESSTADEYRFTWDALEPGQTLRIKVDGQVNPQFYSFTSAQVALMDGERLVSRQDIQLRIWP